MRNNVQNIKTGKTYFIEDAESFVAKNNQAFRLLLEPENILSEAIIEKENQVKARNAKPKK